MLVRMHDGRERFIDFREKAPLRARPGMYLDRSGNVIPNASLRGYRAVGVPGTVMGMERARELFGTMPRAQLLAPAISLAQKGFVLAFYDGPIAREIVAASNANGGILTLEDFKQYTLDESRPLDGTYRGYDIASAPPPSSGGTTMCEILNVVAPARSTSS